MFSVIPPPDPDVSLSPTVTGVFKLAAPGLYGFTSCLPDLGDAVFVAPPSGVGPDAGALVSMILSYAEEAGPVTFEFRCLYSAQPVLAKDTNSPADDERSDAYDDRFRKLAPSTKARGIYTGLLNNPPISI